MKTIAAMRTAPARGAMFAIIIVVFLAGNASAQITGLIQPPVSGSATTGSTFEIDPLFAAALQSAPVAEPIQAVVTLHHQPVLGDLLAIQALGVQTRTYRTLPMVAVRGSRAALAGLTALPGLRSIYLNRRLAYFLNESVPLIGADRVWNELGYTGKGVTVAVIDSGIDATHSDLPFRTKVVQNVKLAPDLFGTQPLVLEGLSDTDTSSGHGTHVASTVGGTGAALGGKYRGVAPGSSLVGVGAGETLFILTALEAFDWVLNNRSRYGIRVISNSWGSSGSFSADDPINVASRLAHDAGLNIVFAAGNDGPAANTLNPYCVAPWVVCVAAGQKYDQSLADFSSRGIPGDALYHPTITAPGTAIVAARAKTGVFMNTFFAVDAANLGSDAVSYTAASGTSMATPHVSGVIALMLEANPALTPDRIKSILQLTATPMRVYLPYETGAGYLNAYAAVSAAR